MWTWQLLVILNIVFATTSFLLLRLLGQSMAKYNRLINAVFTLVFLYPTGLIFAAFLRPDLAIGWYNLVFILLGSMLFPIVFIMAFRANKDIDAGLFTILNNITPIVTITAASLLLNESLHGQQLLGAAIIIGAAFLITAPKLVQHKKSKVVGIEFALVSIVLLGLAFVFERWMLSRVEFGAYLVYGWGAQALWMTLLAMPDRRLLTDIIENKYRLRKVILFGLSGTLRGLTLIGALALATNVSVLMALKSIVPVVVVLTAFVFLKERDWLWLKITAASIGAIGLIVLNG